MNKFVLIIFVGVLTIVLIVGFLYLKQTNLVHLPQIGIFNLGYIPIENAAQEAAKNCKNTGINDSKNINSYLTTFLPKIGANQDNTKNNQLVDLGNSCWGFWMGESNGKGTLFWEGINGNINQIKAIVKL